MIEQTKCCTKCGECKPLTAFPARKDRPSGRKSACMGCTAEYMLKRLETMGARDADAENAAKAVPLAAQDYAAEHLAWHDIDRTMRGIAANGPCFSMGAAA